MPPPLPVYVVLLPLGSELPVCCGNPLLGLLRSHVLLLFVLNIVFCLPDMISTSSFIYPQRLVLFEYPSGSSLKISSPFKMVNVGYLKSMRNCGQ